MDNVSKLKAERDVVLAQCETLIAKSGFNDQDKAEFDRLQKRVDDLNYEIRHGFHPSKGDELLPRISDPRVNFDHEDKGKYSLARAIRRTLEGKRLDGLEAEINDELTLRNGKAPSHQGAFYMPKSVRANLTTTTGVGALSTVTEADYITVLRNASLLGKVKVTSMSKLQGIIRIPRATSTATTAWLTEGATVSPSSPSLDYVQMTPKTLAANTVFTRQFLMQSSFDPSSFVTQDLALSMGHEVDRVIVNGAGTGAEPLGLLNNSGVGTVSIGSNGGELTWPIVVSLETALTNANAVINDSAVSYVTSSKGLAMMKTISKVSGYPIFLYDQGKLNGIPVVTSNVVPSNLTKGTGVALTACLLGDFSQLLVGYWGNESLEILVDPFSQADAGNVRIVAYETMDIEVRHPESFVKLVDAMTS